MDQGTIAFTSLQGVRLIDLHTRLRLLHLRTITEVGTYTFKTLTKIEATFRKLTLNLIN